MRNLTKVLECWRNGKFRSGGNVGTDGKFVYSYSEPIAVRVNGETWVLEPGVFSQTTTKHCNAVARECVGVVKRVSVEEIRGQR